MNQRPGQRGKGCLLGILSLLAVGVVVILAAMVLYVLANRQRPTEVVAQTTRSPQPTQATATPLPKGTKVTVEENAQLWAMADVALVQFVGWATVAIADEPQPPLSDVQREQYLRVVDEFARALANLKNVTPPGEQAKLHNALLPVYGEIHDAMGKVFEGLGLKNRSSVEVQWERLGLLVAEARATTELLAASTSSTTPGR